ncbi:putative carbonic anhydrase 5 [Nematolebias whitei]|uniref:putative carbonic anhydrase 5 n=1 Tax=Nematolebias whitei TaxID=451745 RepID=UPI0018986FB9|nr:putative carbonic anhydrase 5 [Nematolebias whitei]
MGKTADLTVVLKTAIDNLFKEVECVLQDNLVEVSGGGLNYVYSTLQFHFHWGTEASNSLGSEHTVDSQRYPMELHIVSKRKDLTLEEAFQTSDGMAVLAFFIEVTSGALNWSDLQPTTSTTTDMTPWKKLTNYFSAIQNISTKVEVTDKISIDDLLGSVNRDSYYRYSGSLTTPTCNEAVVWTIFKETVKVDENLMVMFPKFTTLEDFYRPIQSVNGRKIYSTSAATAPRSSVGMSLCICPEGHSTCKAAQDVVHLPGPDQHHTTRTRLNPSASVPCSPQDPCHTESGSTAAHVLTSEDTTTT